MRVIQCLRLRPKAGMFGVEIEAEGAGLDIPENKFWRQEADGSLRSKPECCEYVFKEPLSYEDSITAVGCTKLRTSWRYNLCHRAFDHIAIHPCQWHHLWWCGRLYLCEHGLMLLQ